MITLRKFRTIPWGVAVILVVAGGVSSLSAATWTGGDADDSLWSSPDNWGGTAPVSPEALIFDGTTRLENTNDYTANTAFNGLTFNSGAGAFVLGGNAITLGGNIVNNSANLQTINLGLVFSDNRTVDTAAGAITINSVISGNKRLTKNGTGTLTLSPTTAANTVNGVVVNAGTLVLGGNKTSVDSGLTINAGATVRLDGSGDNLIDNKQDGGWADKVIVNGTLDLNGKTEGLRILQGSGLITNNASGSTATLKLNDTQDGTSFSGTIADGAEGEGLVKVEVANSSKTLSGANTYSGGTYFNGGTLVLGSNSALGAGVITMVTGALTSNGATDRSLSNNLTQSGTSGLAFGSSTTGNLSFGELTKNNNGNNNFTINNAQTSFTAIHKSEWGDAANTLTKLGTGTLVIGTNASDFSGKFVVSAGALRIDGDVSTANLTTVNTGGTLTGSGKLGAVTVNAGGKLAPGNSIATFGTKNLILAGALDAELGKAVSGAQPVAGSDYDQVDVTGTVDLTGGDLTLSLGTGMEVGDIYFLIKNDGTDAITGNFATLGGVTTDLTEGAVFSAGDSSFKISYAADAENGVFADGNDLALQYIPEPAIPALIAVGAALMALCRKSRV